MSVLLYAMDRTEHFYANPTYAGGSFPVFAGSRRRRGGGVLGILKSLALPVLKGVARKGASEAFGLAKDVVGDLAAGRNLRSSVMRHGMRRAKRLGTNVLQSALGSVSNRTPQEPPPKRRKQHPAAKARQTTRRRRSNF